MERKTFFDNIEGEMKAYWFGFLCADGCIYRSGRQCAVTLAARDAQHLAKFAAIFDRPVRRSSTYDRRTGKVYVRVRCVLSSRHLCTALVQRGFHDGSHSLDFIGETDLPHFVRGYFDGDGHVGVVNRHEWRVVFVGDSDFVRALRDRLCKRLGLRHNAVHCGGGVHRIGWGGVWQVNRLRNFLYANATVWLERKRDRFDQVPAKRGSSRYIGVYRPAGRETWVARIYVDGATRHIASCRSEEQAALAYDAAAAYFYGEHALQNFPEQGLTA